MRFRTGEAKSKRGAVRAYEKAWRRFVEPLELRTLLSVYIAGNLNPFPSIQAAVDAATPGATINCDPGTYSELVVVYKQLTIKGAQAGVDGRLNSRRDRAVESIVNGNLNQSGTRSTSFYLTTSNIILDGFIIEGQNATSTYGAGVHMAAGVSGIQLLNNIVQNNSTGVQFTNSNAANPLIIRRNLFRDNNNDGPHTGRALYTDGSISGGNASAGLNGVIIDQNAFWRNRGISTFQFQPAIGFEASVAQQTNIQITNNVFDRNGKHLLAFNASNLTITGNWFGDANDTTSAGIRFEGGVTNTTIQNNNIYGSGARGIRIDKKGNPGATGNFTITGNNFFRNGTDSGGQNAALYINAGQIDGPVNATGNWWNAVNGPSGDWAATVGSGDAVKIFGNTGVTVAPYAANPIIERETGYWGAPQVVTSAIQFEDFDHGGIGVAYDDTTPTSNSVGAYRSTQSVDIDGFDIPTTEYFLTNVKANEWVKYTVNVPVGGTFTLMTNAGNTGAGGMFRVEIDSPATSTGNIAVPNTGSLTTFADVSTPNIDLTAGTHVLRVFFVASSGVSGVVGSFNSFKFTQTAVAGPTVPTNLVAMPVSGVQQINLTWVDNATNETGYIVERSNGGLIGWTNVATLPANTSSYSNIGPALAPGVKFYYRVRATSGTVDSVNSNTASAIVWTPAVAAPSGVKAIAASTTLVNVSWIDTVSNELSFKIERSLDGIAFTQIGTANANATTYPDTTTVAGTQYWYRVRASNASGDSYFAGPVKVTTPAAPSLPAPWVTADIGAVAAGGTASFSGGTFTVTGSGADIWDTADEFRYVYQPWSGNGQIIARIAGMQNTNVYAKAGVMFRETLAAGSKEVSANMTPNSGILLMDRVATNGVSDGVFVAGSAPIWLKLTRSGNLFTAATSPNGTTWTNVGSTTVSMTSNIFVGMGVSSRNNGVLNTATFTNVSVTSSTSLVAENQAARMTSIPATKWRVPTTFQPVRRTVRDVYL